MSAADRQSRLRSLRQASPRNWIVWGTGATLLGLVLASLASLAGGSGTGGWTNLRRFAGELVPFPVREYGWFALGGWLWAELPDLGPAVASTLALSLASIAIAIAVALPLGALSTRRLSAADPWAPTAEGRTAVGVSLRALSTAALLGLRAIPAYVWAFLLLSLLGTGAWPAVIALALHNAGILGKLGGETVDDLEPGPLRALRTTGATRLQTAVLAAAPLSLNRWLLYAVVRWESAVRESTVLGALGFVSLGWFIVDARSRLHYDTMLLYVLAAAALVMAGDVVSVWVRGRLRLR